jgi:hypothetical protein
LSEYFFINLGWMNSVSGASWLKVSQSEGLKVNSRELFILGDGVSDNFRAILRVLGAI